MGLAICPEKERTVPGAQGAGNLEASSVLLNQVHTPECSKAQSPDTGAVKERAALMAKAPVRGDRSQALTP